MSMKKWQESVNEKQEVEKQNAKHSRGNQKQ